MEIINLLDMLGLLFGVTGAILVGNVNKKGFLFFTIGSLCHGTMGLMQSNYGLMTTCVIFVMIDIYYYLKWSRDGISRS